MGSPAAVRSPGIDPIPQIMPSKLVIALICWQAVTSPFGAANSVCDPPVVAGDLVVAYNSEFGTVTCNWTSSPYLFIGVCNKHDKTPRRRRAVVGITQCNGDPFEQCAQEDFYWAQCKYITNVNYSWHRLGSGYSGVRRVFGQYAYESGGNVHIVWPIVALWGTNIDDEYYSLHAGCGSDDGKDACNAICRALWNTDVLSDWSVPCGSGYPDLAKKLATKCVKKLNSSGGIGESYDDYETDGYTHTCTNPMSKCSCANVSLSDPELATRTFTETSSTKTTKTKTTTIQTTTITKTETQSTSRTTSTTTTATTSTTTTNTFLQTTATTSTTTTGVEVVVNATVNGVSYSALSGDTKLYGNVELAIAESIATRIGLGVTNQHVAVDLQPGSVAVIARVSPPGHVLGDSIQLGLGSNFSVLMTEMEARLRSVSGLQAVLTGNLSVTLLGIVVTRPVSGCSISCFSPIHVPNGKMGTACAEGGLISSFGVCTPQCNDGYQASLAILHCFAGQLSPQPTFTCQPSSCILPRGGDFGSAPGCAEGDVVEHGAVCTARCADGFMPSTSSVTCRLGSLSSEIICKPASCSAPSADACTEGQIIEHGTTCSGRCPMPLIATPQLLVCIQRRLVPPTFNCSSRPEMSCTSPSGVSHARVPACRQGSSVESGTFCQASCQAGYQAAPSTLACVNSDLQPSTFSCKAPCSAPQPAQNARIPSCLEGASVGSGAVCTAACATGAVPTLFSLSCSDGVLNGSFSCEPASGASCAAPPSVNGRAQWPCAELVVLGGAMCAPQCRTGYIPNPSTLRCNNGHLTPDTFTCSAAPCMLPVGVENSVVDICEEVNGDRLLSGQRCTVRCRQGYVPKPTVLVCYEGSLNSATFACLYWPVAATSTVVGPEYVDAECTEGMVCRLLGLQGMGLHEGDGIMLLSACTGNVTSLAVAGFPSGRIEASECGTNYVFGRLSAGSTAMCWCPKAIACGDDIANYRRFVGTLTVRCSEGFYFTGTHCAVSSCAAPPNQTCLQGNVIVHGGVCNPACSGAMVAIPSRLLCINGSLDRTTFSCSMATVPPCEPPNGIAFSADPACLEGVHVANGTSCTSSCAAGFQSTVASLACFRGKLSPSAFQCQESPCLLPVIEHAQSWPCELTGNGSQPSGLPQIRSGEECVLKCQPDHVPFPARSLCFRGILTPAVSQCLLWADQQVVEEAGFGPSGSVKKSCGMDSTCKVTDIDGLGLLEGDKFMLLTQCGAMGRPLSDQGWPTVPSYSEGCGHIAPIGMLPMATTKVGLGAICFCPISIDCGIDPANFWKMVGVLEVTCPTAGNELGYYTEFGSCRPCNSSSGRECGICKNNMQKFTKNGRPFCSCPVGQYEAAGNKCLVCGLGFYCPGPDSGAARIPCEPGFSTLSQTSQFAADCQCDVGHMPQSDSMTNATACVKCQAGYYKSAVANERCPERCMPAASSALGAGERGDCYCVEGFFYVAGTQTCDQCPPLGVDCPGGFINGSTDPLARRVSTDPGRKHRPPSAQSGFFMTGLGLAAECSIEVDDESVCQGGPLDKGDTVCLDGHVGLVCGACANGYSRDQPLQACQPCEGSAPLMIIGMNLDLACRAALGLFLAQRAMGAAISEAKLDAALLRVWMQWLAVGKVLATVDFSSIEGYGWAKERIEQARLADGPTSEENPNDFSTRFQWPTWFQEAMAWVTVLSEFISGNLAVSSQEALECMVDHRHRHLVPVIYWALYPLFVTCWLAILCVLLAKCAQPLRTRFMTKAMVHSLTTAGGFTREEAERKVGSLKPHEMDLLASDPVGSLRCPEKINEIFGQDTATRIMAHRMYKASPDLFKNEQEVLEVLEQMQVAHVPDNSLPTLRNVLINPKVEACRLSAIRHSMQIDTAAAPVIKLQVPDTHAQAVFSEKGLGHHRFPVFGLFKGISLRDVAAGFLPVVLITLYQNWVLITKRLLSAVQTRFFSVQPDMSLAPDPQYRWTGDTRLLAFQGEHIPISLVACIGLLVWSMGFLLLLGAILNKRADRLQEFSIRHKFGYFYVGLEDQYWWWDIFVKRLDILLMYMVTYVRFLPDVKGIVTLFTCISAVFWALHAGTRPYDMRNCSLVDRMESAGLRVRFFTFLLVQILVLIHPSTLACTLLAVLLVLFNLHFVLIMAITFTIATGACDPLEEAEEAGEDGEEEDNDTGGDGDGGDPIQLAVKAVVKLLLKKVLMAAFGLLLIPLKRVAGVKKTLEDEVPRLAWNGVGRPLEIIEYDPGFALLGTSSGMYLTPCEDGSLTLSNEPWVFQLLPNAMLPFIASSLGVHEVDCIYETKDALVRALKENFQAVDPRADMGCFARWWHRSQLLRSWISRHYELDHCTQRAYLARTIGSVINLLLAKGNLHSIPTNINDLLCLVPLAIRNIRSTGGDTNIAKFSTQDFVFDELQRLLDACWLEEKERELDGMPKKRFYTHSATILRSVTAEEIMCLHFKLRQLDPQELMRFLDGCVGVLEQANDFAEQRKASWCDNKWSYSKVDAYI